jgi:hypothetical protein
MMMPSIQSRRVQVAIGVGVVALLAIVFIYGRFFRQQPEPPFESEEDQFLFGSVASDTSDRLPYWMWLVLPRIFPDLLPGPGGYTALGLQSKEGYDMPIGLSRMTAGYPRVGMNCAMCHTPGNHGPPDDAVARRYASFLASAAADPRFTSSTILGEIAKNHRLSAVDRLLYRLVIIPQAREDLRALKDRRELWDHAAMPSKPAVERAKNYINR